MSLLKLNQKEKKKVAGTSQHTILPSATHLLPPRSGHMLWPELGRTRPIQARLTQAETSYTAQNIKCIFRLSALPPSHVLSFPIDAVQLFAKNSKAKKICFFLISCSLQRFYFVKKGNKGTKTKFLWRNPQLRSYRLTSVLRALKQSSLCFSLSRDVTLCPLAPLSLSLLSQT